MSTDLSRYRRILIIRLSSLGDVLLTTPLLRSIKKTNPSIKIDFIVRKELEETIKFNPNLDNLISLKRDYTNREIRNQIVENNYDMVIDLQSNFRSRLMTYNLKSQIVRYKKPYLKRFLLTKLKINMFEKSIPIPVRYANAIPNFHLDDGGLELFIPEGISNKLPESQQYIGFCPGAKHKTKRWPKEYFIDLGNILTRNDYKIVLFGGKDDQEICEEIAYSIKDSINLSNENKLLDLANDIKHCKLVVCNDSGLMHTSLAVGTPVIAIFGSTVKEFGFYPYKGKNLVLENNSLSCRPCSHIGRNKCPKSHLNCLCEIKPEIVYKELKKFINN